MVQIFLGETPIKFSQERGTYEKEVVVENEVGGFSRYQVDEEGVVKTIEFDFTGAFDEITSIDIYGLYYAFSVCTGITGSVSFPELTTVESNGLYYAFQGCTGITGSVSFPKLTSIDTYGLYKTFGACTGITSISFPKLTSIDTYGLYYAFEGCTGITGSVSFPELTTIESNGLNYAFEGCTGITELHFRADAQSVIESQNGYSTNFGATNATIYFDL